MRHGHTVESTRTVLRHILPMPPTIIQIQTEMRVDGLSLIETAVGSGLSKEIEETLATCNKERAHKHKHYSRESDLVQTQLLWEREHAELKKGQQRYWQLFKSFH